MTTMQTAAPHRPPGPAVAAGVLGLASAAGTGFLALVVVGMGRMDDGGWAVGGWALLLLVTAAAQAWGAVRLLRRRGWLLLALSSLPGLLPLGAMVALRQEYQELEPTPMDLVAAVPLLTLLVTLLPSVRRWATTGRPAR